MPILNSKTPAMAGVFLNLAALRGAVAMTNIWKKVEYLTQAIDQPQDDSHHHRDHDYGKN